MIKKSKHIILIAILIFIILVFLWFSMVKIKETFYTVERINALSYNIVMERTAKYTEIMRIVISDMTKVVNDNNQREIRRYKLLYTRTMLELFEFKDRKGFVNNILDLVGVDHNFNIPDAWNRGEFPFHPTITKYQLMSMRTSIKAVKTLDYKVRSMLSLPPMKYKYS